MKKIIILISLLIFFNSCKKEKNVKIVQTNFDFLINKWIRTNDKKGSTTYENWTKVNANLYQGLGYTLKGKDTIFKENMELKNENKHWSLIVYGVHEKPVSFKLTSFSNINFVAENPINEFPKIIKYQLKEEFLFAEVIADSLKIPFKFKKVNK